MGFDSPAVEYSRLLQPRRARGCTPEFVAYGHYPLGVIAFPETRPWYAPDPVAPPPAQKRSASKAPRPLTLRSVLQKRRVQVDRPCIAAARSGWSSLACRQRLTVKPLFSWLYVSV